MVFSSTVFLCAFLPVVICMYYIAAKKYRNYILLVGSLLFYAWGELHYLYVIAIIILLNYFMVIQIDAHRERQKALITATVILNLALLFIFKYLTFIIGNLNTIFRANFYTPEISLPLGMSFFTFQAMSYSIDVYRKKAKVQRNIWDFILYIAFFPKLTAGPIVQYNSIGCQLRQREESLDKFTSGVKRFIIGLGKKAILADSCTALVEKIFIYEGAGNVSVSVLMAWLGVLAYSFQLYYDFSGYSDMAIGLGEMFGFEFEENFNYPYASKSIQEYWRRWHVSLGAWFREYVYYPVVTSQWNIKIAKCIKKWFGSKLSRKLSVCVPLFIVWFLTGIWHGASWNYVGWGIFFSMIIIAENLGVANLIKKLPSFCQYMYTWILVAVSRAIVMTTSIPDFFRYIRCLFGLNRNALADMPSLVYANEYKLLLIICAALSVPLIPWLSKKLVIFKAEEAIIKSIIYTLVFIVSIAFMVANTYTPFIYFNY